MTLRNTASQREDRAYADASMVTEACAQCGESVTDVLAVTRDWFRAHARDRHGVDTVAVEAARRRLVRSWGGKRG